MDKFARIIALVKDAPQYPDEQNSRVQDVFGLWPRKLGGEVKLQAMPINRRPRNQLAFWEALIPPTNRKAVVPWLLRPSIAFWAPFFNFHINWYLLNVWLQSHCRTILFSCVKVITILIIYYFRTLISQANFIGQVNFIGYVMAWSRLGPYRGSGNHNKQVL